LVVHSSSDGQGLLVEVPSLGASSIWCLDNHIPVVDEIEVSMRWQLSDNVEVSFNIETKVCVELSFYWFSFPFISIDNIPLLVKCSSWLVVVN
jgi:hypothetical protein